MLCHRETEWGLCRQPAAAGSELCVAHLGWADRGVIPDRYYHRKIVEGLIEPTWVYMSDREAKWLLNGRHRGDGRREDQWVSALPLGVKAE